MSTGLMVEMGGRPCFLFTHYDNDKITKVLHDRANEVLSGRENHNSAAVWLTCEMVLQTLKIAKEKYPKQKDYHSFCLVQAGEFIKVVKRGIEPNDRGKYPVMSDQAVAQKCKELADWIRDNKPPIMDIGLNQLIARLYNLILHQERVSQPDYYALWAWDFDKNGEAFELQ